MATFVGAANPLSVQLPMFDGAAGDGSGQGNEGAAGGQGAGSGSGQGTGSQGASAGAQSGSGGTGAGGQGGGGTQFTYGEDRSKWIDPAKGEYVPRTRLNELTTRFTNEINTLKTQLGSNTDIVSRLKQVFTGEPSQQDKEANEIKEAIVSMFPGLKAIEKLTPEQLQEVLESADAGRQSAHNHWTQHATRMLDTLTTEVTKAMGVEKLTDSQARRLKVAYREELAVAVAARERAAQTGEQYDAANDALAKHERGDVAFLKEFTKQFLDDFYEPARRSATTAALRRTQRPVPKGGRESSQVTSKLPEIDYNDDNAFAKAMREARAQG